MSYLGAADHAKAAVNKFSSVKGSADGWDTAELARGLEELAKAVQELAEEMHRND